MSHVWTGFLTRIVLASRLLLAARCGYAKFLVGQILLFGGLEGCPAGDLSGKGCLLHWDCKVGLLGPFLLELC
jgi:hypothetical protein